MTNSSSQIVFVVVTTIFVIICISSCSISMSATVTEAEIYGRNQQKIKCPCKQHPNHCRVHCTVHCRSHRNSPENRRLLSMRVKAAEREADRAVQLTKKPGDVSKEKLVAAQKIREYQALKSQLDHTVM